MGYDTGFYRRYLIEPMQSFPNVPVPGLGDDALVPRLLLDSLRLLQLPTDIILYGSYLLFFALLPVILFAFLRPHFGTRAAFIGGLLLVGSAVAYNAYWYMLFKNALALCLILVAFIGLDRRWGAPLFLLDLVIAYTHKTSAVLYLLTLVALFALSPGRRRELFLHIALVAAALISVNLPSIREAATVFPMAVFLDWPMYLTFSVPLLLLVAGTLMLPRGRSLPRVLIAFAAVSFLFPILRLPFYERIFIFCDLALIGFAAYGADLLVTRFLERKAYPKSSFASGAVLCIAGGLLLGNLWNQFVVLRPLMSVKAIEEITQIGRAVPPHAILLTSSDEAPWYEGWTRAHVAAPGLLNDAHDLEEWSQFWSATTTEAQIAFLASFPQPLYISTLGEWSDLIGRPPECLEYVRPHLLYNACAGETVPYTVEWP